MVRDKYLRMLNAQRDRADEALDQMIADLWFDEKL